MPKPAKQKVDFPEQAVSVSSEHGLVQITIGPATAILAPDKARGLAKAVWLQAKNADGQAETPPDAKVQ